MQSSDSTSQSTSLVFAGSRFEAGGHVILWRRTPVAPLCPRFRSCCVILTVWGGLFTLLCPSIAGSIKNRMLMLDGMPTVRVKAEPLESEQGVSEPLFFWLFSPVIAAHSRNCSQAWPALHTSRDGAQCRSWTRNAWTDLPQTPTPISPS